MSAIMERERDRRRRRRRVLRWVAAGSAVGGQADPAPDVAAGSTVGGRADPAPDVAAVAAALTLVTGDGAGGARPAFAGTAEGWVGGLAALAAGDVVRAHDLLVTEAAALRRTGRPARLVPVLGLQTEASIARGDWDTVASAAAECRVLARRTAQPVWQACATAAIALVEAVRGDSESAGRHAAEAEIIGGAAAAHPARFARGVALLSAERYQEAYTVLLPLLDGPHRADAVGHLAEAALHSGRRAPVPAGTGANALYARALLDGDEALFAEARREAARTSPWLTARIDLEYGCWLRRQRRVNESRLPMEMAKHAFEVLGAVTWERRAGRELRAAGGGPAVGGLSAQELEIARLVADGLSNREIGERMFLSPRTIGSHLYRIFPKLKVTSRAHLAGRIADVTNGAFVRS
jgi:DNA-binding CsgD family transcriptional regulator